MDDYVSKPVKPETILAAIKRFTERAPGVPIRPPGRSRAAAAPGPARARRAPGFRRLATTDAGPIIDLEMLAGFRDLEEDGESLLVKLILVFLENSPKLLEEARTALQSRGGPALARAAHTLKGSCSNFGAERLRAACERLEHVGNAGQWDRAAEVLVTVVQEFVHVREALERECAARRPCPMKILVAEDDPVSVKIIQVTLEHYGHEVVVTNTGEEAWEAFDREPVRAILSDWMMPGMSGLELCRAGPRAQEAPTTPISSCSPPSIRAATTCARRWIPASMTFSRSRSTAKP